MKKPKYEIGAYVELDRNKIKGNYSVNPKGFIKNFRANTEDPLYGWYSMKPDCEDYLFSIPEDCIIRKLPKPAKIKVEVSVREYFDFKGNNKLLEERTVLVNSFEEAIAQIKKTIRDYGDYNSCKIEHGSQFRLQKENSIISMYPTINSFDFAGLVGDCWSNTIVAEKFFGELTIVEDPCVKHSQYPRNLFNI